MSLPEQTLLSLIEIGDKEVVQSPNWYNELRAAINDLISEDFSKLVQILYRADVSETRLKRELAINKNTDAGTIIANLFLERQKQKIESKRSSSADSQASDEERW